MTCWLTVSDTLGNKQALVETLADTVPEMEDKSVGDTLGNAQALVDTLADTVAEEEALTSGDTLRDAHALNYLLGDTWTRDGRVIIRRHTGQCAGTCQRTR